MKVLLFFVMAMLATVPSYFIAKFWLSSQGIAIPEGDDVVPVFMRSAPAPLKFALIGLNGTFFVALIALLWLW